MTATIRTLAAAALLVAGLSACDAAPTADAPTKLEAAIADAQAIAPSLRDDNARTIKATAVRVCALLDQESPLRVARGMLDAGRPPVEVGVYLRLSSRVVCPSHGPAVTAFTEAHS